MRNLKVKIHRYSKEKGEYIQEYNVPLKEHDEYSAMNILEYIHFNLDSSLAFFHHAACKQAVCGGCLLRINGELKLACKEKVIGDYLELASAKQIPVKDLL